MILQVTEVLNHQYSQYIQPTGSLRILRVLGQFADFRNIFSSAIKIFPSMFKALVLSFLILLGFSVYGVNLFANGFGYCNDPNISTMEDCVGVASVSALAQQNNSFIDNTFASNSNYTVPRVWKNPESYSFDDLGQALLTLFEVATTSDWLRVLASGMSISNYNFKNMKADEPKAADQVSPVYGASALYSIFFVVYIFVGSFSSIQLFTAVMIQDFRVHSGVALLRIEQRIWIDLKGRLKLLKPKKVPPFGSNRLRRVLYDLVSKRNGWFQILQRVLLLLNVGFLLTSFENQPPELTRAQSEFDSAKRFIFESFATFCLYSATLCLYSATLCLYSATLCLLFRTSRQFIHVCVSRRCLERRFSCLLRPRNHHQAVCLWLAPDA
jgi:hypothetical protein